MKKKYIVDGKIYEVPDTESAAFLKDFPNAKVSYNIEGKEYQIPHQETESFETDMGLKKKEISSVGSDAYSFDKVLNPTKQQGNLPLPQPVTPIPKQEKRSEQYLDAPFITPQTHSTFQDATKIDRNVAGNLWNRFTVGMGRLAATGADIVANIGPVPEGMTREEFVKQIRRDVAEPSRTATKELIGANVTPEQEKAFNENLVTSTVGGLAEMLPGTGGKGLGLLLQAYDQGMESVNSSEEGRKLPENVKTIYSGAVGITVGLMDRLALTKIFGKQSNKIAAGLTTKVINELIKKTKGPITAEMAEAAIMAELKSLKNQALNSGKKLVQSAGIEGLTEGAQEGVTMLAEKVLNKSQDKEVFEEKSWKDNLERIATASAQGGIGGTMMGAASLPFNQSKNYIAEKIADAKSEEDIVALKEELMASAQEQHVSEKEAQHLSETIDNYIRVNRKVPDTVPNRKIVVDKIVEREDIQQEIEAKKAELENIDEAFQGEVKQDIELLEKRAKEINEELAEPEKLKEEVPEPSKEEIKTEEPTVSKVLDDWKAKLKKAGKEYDPKNSFVDFVYSKGIEFSEYEKLNKTEKDKIQSDFKNQSVNPSTVLSKEGEQLTAEPSTVSGEELVKEELVALDETINHKGNTDEFISEVKNEKELLLSNPKQYAKNKIAELKEKIDTINKSNDEDVEGGKRLISIYENDIARYNEIAKQQISESKSELSADEKIAKAAESLGDFDNQIRGVKNQRQIPNEIKQRYLDALKSLATKKEIDLTHPSSKLYESVYDILEENNKESKQEKQPTVLEGGKETKQNEPIQENVKATEPVATEKTGEPKSEPIEVIKQAEEGGGGKEPPVVEEVPEKEGGKLNDKGILNRLHKAENVPEQAKKGFEEKGLKYDTKSQPEAEAVAKSVIDDFGIEDAVLLADAQKFDGDVNSLIYAESLNRLAELESKATTPEAKLEYAKQFAEISIKYDEAARKGGRFNAAVNYFYKKSPLGVKIKEEARRSEAFTEFSKNKDKSWKDFFEEMKKEPDFEKMVKEQVDEGMKKERAETRKTRKEKVHKIIDDTAKEWAKKLSAKGAEGAKKSGADAETVLKSVAEIIKKAYDAGELAVKIIDDAVKYVSKELGIKDWGEEEFRKHWETKLRDPETKKPLTDAELKSKTLDKFRNKLKGLNEKQKDEVIRKSFKKLVENGALEYADFKKIIADTIGYGEMTAEQAQKITDLIKDINKVDELGKIARETDRSEKARQAYLAAKSKAEKSATELGKIVFNKIDLTKRILGLTQLNTLGLSSLVNNPIFNIINQAAVRLPRSLVMTAMDYAGYGVGKIFGKDLKPTTNTILAQREFYNKLWMGTKQSADQFMTGLTNRDYFQKEVRVSQIDPIGSWGELWDFARGRTKLSPKQVVDKLLQGTLGIPAELVARVLNMGDKPQRFATEGGQATTFAHNLGLQGIDYKLFMEFPKEEAYRKFKSKGMSDEVAMKKAEDIKDQIIKEGEESTFQQDNLLNDAITAAFKPFGKAGDVVKTLNMPFVKIPLNAFWSTFNLVNPEVALLQSITFAVKAIKTKSPLDIQASKKWFAHAATGLAWMGVTGMLAKQGIVNPANEDETTKKEREGEQNYEQQNTLNVSKLIALISGKNPKDVKNGLLVDLKWLGTMGMMMGYQASKLEKMTPEQKEKGIEFTEDMLINLKESSLDFIDKGVFSNSGALLTAINKGGPFMDSYLLNLMNMGVNTVHPAMFAQMSKASLPYYTKTKADSFAEEVKNSLLSRSGALRNITGQMPPSKIGIWGDVLDKKDNWTMRLFGMSRSRPDNFAQPIYEDYKETNDTRFFPSAVKPEIKEGGETIKLNQKEATELEKLVGESRKNLVSPYINDMATFEGSSKKYSDLNNEDKVDKLQILYDLGYESGKQKFLLLHPEYKSKSLTPVQENKKEAKQDENTELKDLLKEKLKLN